MTRRSIARSLGLLIFLLLNLAIFARPSSAGWQRQLCELESGEIVACCTYCILCWRCTLDGTEVVE